MMLRRGARLLRPRQGPAHAQGPSPGAPWPSAHPQAAQSSWPHAALLGPAQRTLHSSTPAPALGSPPYPAEAGSPPAEAAGSTQQAAGSFRAPLLTLESISPAVRQCEYAVRGAIVSRALALEAQLQAQPGSLPFPSVVFCNIGNPQALGQAPVTFFREVLALCDHPALLAPANAAAAAAANAAAGGQGEGAVGTSALPFSRTAIARAERLLQSLPAHATGAYSHSQGMPLCRADVAAGIATRDGGGQAVDPESIFLTDGASPAAQMVLRLLVRGPQDGVLCPIPQYPLYSASLALLEGTLVPYFLREDADTRGWRLPQEELQAQAQAAVAQGVTPRAVVVINPGNPTGQVLSLEEQQAVVRFCVEHRLLLLADEVYQENVYAPDTRFLSFRQVAQDMGVGPADLALVSLHSVSKGFYGECGRRGGYMQVSGLPADVTEQLYKLASVTLCSNVAGQVLASLVMRPPVPGEDAFPLFSAEREQLLSSLARRAQYLVERLNAEPGISCCASEGAMYAFPRLHLPSAALAAAAAQGVAADAFYAQRLLEATGIVVVPGSGFGQQPGTWHLRFTILPPEEELPGMMDRFARFHHGFMHEFQ